MTLPTPRPGTKCRRCSHGYAEHLGSACSCPDGSGRTYQRTVPRRGASTSFTPTEIDTLDYIVRRLLRGSPADLQSFARMHAAAVGRLSAKVQGLRAAAERRDQMRLVGGQYGHVADEPTEDESA